VHCCLASAQLLILHSAVADLLAGFVVSHSIFDGCPFWHFIFISLSTLGMPSIPRVIHFAVGLDCFGFITADQSSLLS